MLINLGFTRPRVGAKAIVPTDLAGLIGWYDAADAATITESGGLVSGWADKSGATNHLVGAGNNKPHTGNATLNGLNVINFTNATYAKLLSLTGNTSGGLLTGLSSEASTIALVFRQDAAASNGAPVCLKSTTNADSFIPDLGATNTAYFPEDTGSAFMQMTPTHTPRDNPYYLTFTWSAGGIACHVNGALKDSDTAAASNYLNRFVLGYRVATSQKWSGVIAELCIINRALSSSERKGLERYMKQKWGF